MSTVRAKFVCQSVKSHNQPSFDPQTKQAVANVLYTIELTPVSGNSDPGQENAKLWKASPQGSLMLGMINPDAAAAFQAGHEYYIDFTPA
jgi:hypothetical protein